MHILLILRAGSVECWMWDMDGMHLIEPVA